MTFVEPPVTNVEIYEQQRSQLSRWLCEHPDQSIPEQILSYIAHEETMIAWLVSERDKGLDRLAVSMIDHHLGCLHAYRERLAADAFALGSDQLPSAICVHVSPARRGRDLSDPSSQ